MKVNTLLAPVALAFNLLALPAANAEEPRDFNTLNPDEQSAFVVCQLKGASQENLTIMAKEFDEAQKLQKSQESQNPPSSGNTGETDESFRDLWKMMSEIYIIMAVNYYACGLDMNIDLKTLPKTNINIDLNSHGSGASTQPSAPQP